VLAKDAQTALSLVDAAFTRGQDLAQLAHAFLGHLRDLVVARAVDDASALVDASPTELEALVKAAQSVPAGVPELLFERFAKVAEEVSKSPVPRYVLEVGLIALTRVEPLEPIGTLLQKLEALESRVEKGGGSGGGGVRAPAPALQPQARAAAVDAAPPPVAAPAPQPPPQPQKRAAPQTFVELVERIMEEAPLLAVLAQSRLVARDATKLSLGFDNDFHATQLKDRLPQLRAALKKITGEDLAVEVIIGPTETLPVTENIVEVEERHLDEDREKRRHEAITHPAPGKNRSSTTWRRTDVQRARWR
jgi:DNA polymerase III gamma/tau subunit